jgi:hypothetical protein
MGISQEIPLVAWARADYLGLRLPDDRPRHWGALYVAITPGDLWVAMGNDVRNYSVSTMVLASVSSSPQGAVRVDFMESDPLTVLVNDGGALLERLRSDIWEYDKSLRQGAHSFLGVPEMSPVLLAEAEVEWSVAERLFADANGNISIRHEAERSMRRAMELRHQAQVDALRGWRATLSSKKLDRAID